MKKIYFNESGWVCNRYPYNLAVTDETNFIEVNDEIYNNTLICKPHHAWKVVNGKLSEEQYDIPTEQEIKSNLRLQRQLECFDVLDRSIFWYENLTEAQKIELKTWYNAWLDVTTTKTIPTKPNWLKNIS